MIVITRWRIQVTRRYIIKDSGTLSAKPESQNILDETPRLLNNYVSVEYVVGITFQFQWQQLTLLLDPLIAYSMKVKQLFN